MMEQGAEAHTLALVNHLKDVKATVGKTRNRDEVAEGDAAAVRDGVREGFQATEDGNERHERKAEKGDEDGEGAVVHDKGALVVLVLGGERLSIEAGKDDMLHEQLQVRVGDREDDEDQRREWEHSWRDGLKGQPVDGGQMHVRSVLGGRHVHIDSLYDSVFFFALRFNEGMNPVCVWRKNVSSIPGRRQPLYTAGPRLNHMFSARRRSRNR